MSDNLTFGPFEGYTSSVDRFNTPPEKLTAESADVYRDPFTGGWFRRGGMSVQTSSDTAGMLESKWTARARQGLPLNSSSLTDEPYPTPSVLFSNDTNASTFPTADTGYFGQLAVLNTNGADEWYNLLKDFTSSHYPTLGGTFNTEHRIKVPPLWYESGVGGYTRGAFAFARQFLCAGSRSMLDAGEWRYFGNLRGTPMRWSRTFNNVSGSATTNANRIMPTGPLPPLYPPAVAAGTTATGVTAADANWEDGDSFYVTLVYRFEDGSYSMPFTPRPKSATLTAGLGFVTIGTIGGTAKYRDIQWTKVCQPPAGVTDIILARTGKQKLAAITDTLDIDMGKFYPVGILRVGQKTFTDTLGNDAGLDENTEVIRFDHVMPRRSRYLGTGDQRVLAGFTLPSPHAIVLAPTGVTTSRDTNAADDSATIYGSTQLVYRISTTALELGWVTGASGGTAGVDFNSTSITLSGKTLQDVVDTINATTTALNSKEWAAQLAPGVDGSIDATNLTPTYYSIACTVATTTTLTTAASFADVPVGYRLTGARITAGTYIVSKASATSLTMSVVGASAGADTVICYADTGDDALFSAGGHTAQGYGWIRAYAPSYPGFAYLKRSTLYGYDKPDRAGVHYTIGSPGAGNSGVSMAPNAWVRYNRRAPSFFAGNLLGFADIQGAAVVAYSNGIGMFANIKGVNSGEDFDYKIFTVNPFRGAVSCAGIAQGNGWGAYATLDGVVAVDKTQAEIVLSNDIHNPANQAGSLSYELKTSAASAGSSDPDSDGMRLHLGLIGTRLSLQYRKDSGVTVPNRRILYDFSAGLEASGLNQVADSENRKPFGWSAPFVQSVGPVFAVVRGTDVYVYGSGEANAGTGDGRLDRLDTGDTDNSAAISPLAYMALAVAPPFARISCQRAWVKHYTANGTVTLTVYRNIARTASSSYSLTTGSAVVNPELVAFTQDGRTMAECVEVKWSDGASVAGNGFWQVVLEYQTGQRF